MDSSLSVLHQVMTEPRGPYYNGRTFGSSTYHSGKPRKPFYKVSTLGCIVIATENEPTQGDLWCRDKLRRAEAMGRKPGKRLLESSQ